MSKQLHIVCPYAPYPPDNSCAIDMFEKIVTLHQSGVKIQLHFFKHKDYGNATALNEFCEGIHIYHPEAGYAGLAENILKDEAPVLFEGIHCARAADATDLSHKKTVVRLHNNDIAICRKKDNSRSLMNFFSGRNKRKIKLNEKFFYGSVCCNSVDFFHNELNIPSVEYLPPFVPWNDISGLDGIGNFCLYHGDLSIPENDQAACWLLKDVFTRVQFPLVIAGKNPSRRLAKLAHLYQHTCLVENPSENEMNELVQKAHINILPAFSASGAKMKLLHALFTGRHCVVNHLSIFGSDLKPACYVSDTAEGIASLVVQLYHQPFADEEIKLRKKILGEKYNNKKNAEKLIAWLY